jgi:hypothetical protein
VRDISGPANFRTPPRTRKHTTMRVNFEMDSQIGIQSASKNPRCPNRKRFAIYTHPRKLRGSHNAQQGDPPMMLDWNEYHKELGARIGELAKLTPDTVRGYQTLSAANSKTELKDRQTGRKDSPTYFAGRRRHDALRRLHRCPYRCRVEGGRDERGDLRGPRRSRSYERRRCARLFVTRAGCRRRTYSENTGRLIRAATPSLSPTSFSLLSNFSQLLVTSTESHLRPVSCWVVALLAWRRCASSNPR